MEIKGKQAAVLRMDGTFERVSDKGYHIGDTIDVRSDSSKIVAFSNRATRFIAAAAAVLLIVSGGIGYNTMAVQAYSYVSVDVNPSIEYAVNRLNKVVDVEALNEDAEEVVSSLKTAGVKNKSLAEAMEMTGEILDASGYISEDEDYILVNVTGGDEKHKAFLEKEALAASETFKRGEDVFEISETTKEEWREAREHNMSAGRYKEAKLIWEASDEPSGFMDEHLDEFRNAPIKEMFERSGRIPGELSHEVNGGQLEPANLKENEDFGNRDEMEGQSITIERPVENEEVVPEMHETMPQEQKMDNDMQNPPAKPNGQSDPGMQESNNPPMQEPVNGNAAPPIMDENRQDHQIGHPPAGNDMPGDQIPKTDQPPMNEQPQSVPMTEQ